MSLSNKMKGFAAGTALTLTGIVAGCGNSTQEHIVNIPVNDERPGIELKLEGVRDKVKLDYSITARDHYGKNPGIAAIVVEHGDIVFSINPQDMGSTNSEKYDHGFFGFSTFENVGYFTTDLSHNARLSPFVSGSQVGLKNDVVYDNNRSLSYGWDSTNGTTFDIPLKYESKELNITNKNPTLIVDGKAINMHLNYDNNNFLGGINVYDTAKPNRIRISAYDKDGNVTVATTDAQKIMDNIKPVISHPYE